MRTLYFCKEFDEERCYPLENLKSRGSLMGLRQITVTKAIPINDKDIFYCQALDFAGLKLEGECGKSCNSYSPKNGKSGMCRYQGKCYEPTGESQIIKIKN
jgi:hypothetical protein